MALAIKNSHERDKNITFFEPTHTYTVNGNKDYKSVTTWVHTFFPSFNADMVIAKMKKGKNWNSSNKYYGMSVEEIKKNWQDMGQEAADAGTEMHLNIDRYYNGQPIDSKFLNTKEYVFFLNFYKDHHDLIPFRTEWKVYSQRYKLAGSIDMVFKYSQANDDRLIIVDWKRSKEIKYENKLEHGYEPLTHIGNCNYYHYVLQLNVYKMILEKYYDKKIEDLFLVVLHPSQSNYMKIKVPKIKKEIIEMLDHRMHEITLFPTISDKEPDKEDKIIEFLSS